MKKRVILVSLFAAVLMVTLISPALAKQPVVESFEYHNDPENFFIVCDEGAFTVTFDEYVKGVSILFSDEDGNPDSLSVHFNIHGNATNSETGTSFEDTASFQHIFELPLSDDSLEILVGVIWHLTLPGERVMVIDVGRFVFDGAGNFVSFVGRSEPPWPGDEETFICNAVRGI